MSQRVMESCRGRGRGRGRGHGHGHGHGHGRLRGLVVLVVLAAVMAGFAGVVPEGGGPATASPIAASGSIETKSMTVDAGTRSYQLYRPARARAGQPLIVWLHGASKVRNGDPQELRRSSTLLVEADRRGYSVVAPMQSLTADRQGVWNIFDPANTVRGRGEAAIIAGIVRYSIRELHADPSRVYIVGHSAGGGMTETVSAVYPELFAAMAISAGFPFLFDPTGIAQRTARGGVPMPSFVVTGDRDRVAPPILGGMAVSAALAANGIAGATPYSVTTVGASGADRYPTRISRFGHGRTEVVHADVLGADHPTGPGGVTVNGPALDRRLIAFLLAKRR
ncbi:PHB depolymerase family esterase [Gordonia sp. ABSL1-1]|uniref:alpha/beta hydrolase family esterase n=1 Tax=Gordonia sp. ABSL1-1 TaxID=3053923 RepID=UPI0025741DCD|nr:PHB depolymerase family esterase [Gordonia sp. ABSL1-1]MDL9938236.1 PHB depolymerase family esterase [Gordonia sp. ABSL1-1]